MPAEHVVVMVEEASIEDFLRPLLDRELPELSYEIHSFGGKGDLLSKLGSRLNAYARWIPETWRIIVLIDRDDADCLVLKKTLEETASNAGLQSRAVSPATWQVANRIVVEELEAWYFGDWQAVCEEFPGVPLTVPAKAPFRDPDAIKGGTWEAFERILQNAGHHQGGLRKRSAASALGSRVAPGRSTSKSFQVFWSAVQEAVQT